LMFLEEALTMSNDALMRRKKKQRLIVDVDSTEDPAEMTDLSQKPPEKRKAMLKLWDEYLKTNGGIVDAAGPFVR